MGRKELQFVSEYQNVKSLDIHSSAGEIIIKTGDTFRIEAENVAESFQPEVLKDGTLVVKKEGYGISFLWFQVGEVNVRKVKSIYTFRTILLRGRFASIRERERLTSVIWQQRI